MITKFETKESINTKGEAIIFAQQCEQISDDFAVKFAEWLENNCTSIIDSGVYEGKRLLLSELEYKTTTELLQIFKTNFYESK